MTLEYIDKVNRKQQLTEWTEDTRPTNPIVGLYGFNTTFSTLEFFTKNKKWLLITGFWTTSTRPKTAEIEVGSRGYNSTIQNFESWNGSIWLKEGKSAYELAVDNGFVGTLQNWLDSLKGKDGKYSYPDLENLPKFSGVQIVGDKKVEDYNIQPLNNNTYIFDGYTSLMSELIEDHGNMGIIDLNGRAICLDQNVTINKSITIVNGLILGCTENALLSKAFTLVAGADMIFHNCSFDLKKIDNSTTSALFVLTDAELTFERCEFNIYCIETKNIFNLTNSELKLRNSIFSLTAEAYTEKTPNLSLTAITVNDDDSKVEITSTHIVVKNDIATDESFVNNKLIKVVNANPEIDMRYSIVFMWGKALTKNIIETTIDNEKIRLDYCLLEGNLQVNNTTSHPYQTEHTYTSGEEFIYISGETIIKYYVKNTYTSVDIITDIASGNLEDRGHPVIWQNKMSAVSFASDNEFFAIEEQSSNAFEDIMYFSPAGSGTQDGSSWKNAKAFTQSNYNDMPSNTAAFLLGGTYTFEATLNLGYEVVKPIFGGFTGRGFEREQCRINTTDNIRGSGGTTTFNSFATIFTGANVGINSTYIDNVVIYKFAVKDCAPNGTIVNCVITNAPKSKAEHTVVFNSCYFLNCFDSLDYGGAIEVNGTGVISNCIFENCECSANAGGGAAITSGGKAYNCRAINCSYTGTGYNVYGGGGFAAVNGGEIYNCIAENCSSIKLSGGFYKSGGEDTVNNCSAIGCTAVEAGGGFNGDTVNCKAISCYAPIDPDVTAGTALTTSIGCFDKRPQITDSSSTTPAIDVIKNTDYYFATALDSLTINSINISQYKSTIYFTTSASFTTFSYPGGQKFIGSNSVVASKSYKIEVENGIMQIFEVA